MITGSTEQISPTRVECNKETEHSGFMAYYYQWVVSKLFGDGGEQMLRPGTSSLTLRSEPVPSDTAASLPLRKISCAGNLLPLANQRQSGNKHSQGLFTADELFPDPFEAHQEFEEYDIFDKQPPAADLSYGLWGHFHGSRSLIANSKYEYVGGFICLTPKEKAHHFIMECSSRLSKGNTGWESLLFTEPLHFTAADEATRLEAIQRCFQRLQQDYGFTNHIDIPTDLEVFTDFVKGVHQTVSLEQVFKEWERRWLASAGLPESDTSLYKLMIEGKLCKDETWRFILNDELNYLERCLRAFMWLLNTLADSPDKELSMCDINQAAAVVGSNFCSKENHYGIVVQKEARPPVLIEIMKQSAIINASPLPNEEFYERVEAYLQCKLNDTFKKANKSVIWTPPAKQLKAEGGSYFKLALVAANDSTGTSTFKIAFFSSNKQKDGQKVLEHYYRMIDAIKNDPDARENNDLDIVEAAVEACCKLQRQHPFNDGNGRILFFILLPILLYQQGFWLRKTVDDPWRLVDSIPPRKIAERLLPLCEKRPVFPAPIDWQLGVPEAERVRLLCAMGKTEAFIKTVEQRPELLKHTFRPSNLTLLSIAARNHHSEIVEHILTHYPKSVDPKRITSLIENLNSTSHDKSVINLLQAFCDQHSIRSQPIKGAGDGTEPGAAQTV